MFKDIQTRVKTIKDGDKFKNPMKTTYIGSHGKSCHLGDGVVVKGLNMVSTVDITEQCDIQMDSALY